jgi:glyoxylase-like metal-dependent hydrolase (beta-lactamase superfamily II)
VQEIAPGLSMMDTLLGGMTGITAAYLVAGPQPALVETGARTSAPAVREALADAGVGPDDLAWIVLTHVHLDHCGGTGILAQAFPRATVVVHRRGARHLTEPQRLVAATAAVHGPRWSLYGGLDPTPPERIVAAEDGHRVDLGDGRALTMLETLGHARHHMSILDEASGTVLAGDALGARFPGGGLYPALPPPDIDPARGEASLQRLAGLGPERLCLGHFGPVDDPQAEIALARDQLARGAQAASEGWASGGGETAVAERVGELLPLEGEVGEPDVIARWRWLGWAEHTVLGLAGWAAAQDEAAGRSPPAIT